MVNKKAAACRCVSQLGLMTDEALGLGVGSWAADTEARLRNKAQRDSRGIMERLRQHQSGFRANFFSIRDEMRIVDCGLRNDFGFYIPRSVFRIPHFITLSTLTIQKTQNRFC